MGDTTRTNITLDSDIKEKGTEVLSKLGLNLSAAVSLFLSQVIRTRGIPFEVSADSFNQETLDAFLEVQALKANPNKKTYDSFNEILEELDDE